MESEASGMFDSGVKMGAINCENEGRKKESSFRAEIDTSAPFESVKEAHDLVEVDVSQLEEHAKQLEKDLIVKERETLDVLKELDATKMIVEDLKLKLQKKASEASVTLETKADEKIANPVVKEAGKENLENALTGNQNSLGGLDLCPSSAPGLILMELKQAKLNLTRTTSDLADIRASVESLNKKLEKERSSLNKTYERLTLNSTKISSLEEELNQTRRKLRLAKDIEVNGGSDSLNISKEFQRLSSEAEQFKKMGEAARSEVLRAMSEIEQTKTRMKTAEITLVAAKTMKEAARAAEAVALAEIKAFSNSESATGACLPKPERVTLSFEEYSFLSTRAQDAEELSKRRVIDAMLQVDEANASKNEILNRVEEATEEVKTSKEALEEALNRVKAANKGKLALEEALRRWRSEHGQKRRSVHNSTKFKNSYPSQNRRGLLDVNGLSLASDGSAPVLKPILSIGQILSRKLLLPEECDSRILAEKGGIKRNVSLGQMLNKQGDDLPSSKKVEREISHKQFSAKRKKFGFARFSLLLTKQKVGQRRSQLQT